MKLASRILVFTMLLLVVGLLAACTPVTREAVQPLESAPASDAGTAGDEMVFGNTGAIQLVECDGNGTCYDADGYEYACDDSGVCTDSDGQQYQCDSDGNCAAVGGGGSAPEVASGEATPAAASGEATPAAAGGDATPAAGGDDATPAATGDDVTPAATGGDVTPAATGGDVTPAATGGDVTPAATGGDATPAASGGVTAATKDEIVKAHNRYRAEVGVPDIQWSDSLAAGAQEWADKLAADGGGLVHSSTGLGENLFGGSGKAYTGVNAVESWGSEKANYNGEPVGQEKAVVGHYTQMVWRSTTEVGCASATSAEGAMVWVCRYSPAGNMTGEKPY
jgi:uncharacterized protein YkwD